MKKSDLIISLILGEIIAIFLFFILKSLNFVVFPLWLLFFVLPILALIGLYLAYLIGRKIQVVFQFSKYALVGFANTAVDFGVLNLLMLVTGIYSGKNIFLLNTVSFFVAMTHSYIWNKLWAFKRKTKEKTGKEFLQFITVTILGAVINGGIVYFISTLVSPMFGVSNELWANMAKIVATAVVIIWNFLGYKFIVFDSKKNE